ncbi:hypothetical protein ABPG72_008948 [Tetrahymena utriculariae]
MDGLAIQKDNKLDDDCEIVFFANKQQITFNQPIELIEQQVQDKLLKDPNCIDYLLILGQIKYKFKNDLVRSLEIFKHVLILDPLNIDGRLEIINLFLAKKLYKSTQNLEILFSECFKLDPNYWRVTFMKGMYYQLIFKIQESIQILREGNQIFQNNLWIKILLAQQYCEDKKEACEELLQQALQLKKFNYEVLTGISIICLSQQQYDLAQFYLNKVLKINNNSSSAYSIQAFINKKYHKNLEMCLQNSLKSLELNSTNTLAIDTLYIYYFQKSDEEKKHIYLKKISEQQNINQQKFYEKLFKIYCMYENNLNLSKYYYRKIIRINPRNMQANLIYLKQEDFEDSEELLQSSINFLNEHQLNVFDDNLDYDSVSQLTLQIL